MNSRLLLLPIAALALSACNWSPPVRRPSARVTQVRLVEQTAEAARLEATVELRNPNRVPLPLMRSRYHLRVADRHVSLQDRPHRTLPARGTQTVLLPIAVRTEGRRLAGADYRLTGSVSYDPPGQLRDILTDAGLPLPATAFESRGRLPGLTTETQRTQRVERRGRATDGRR